MIVATKAVIATSVAADAYWLALYGGLTTEQNSAIGSDGSNVYFAGRTDSGGAGSNDIYIAKVDAKGNLQYQKYLGAATSENGLGNAVASDGTVYVAGIHGGAYPLASLSKWDSSGTVQWQRKLDAGFYISFYGAGFDSSGNVYGIGNESSTAAFMFTKYNSSGTIQWQRRLKGGNIDVCYHGTADASGNSYGTGYTRSGQSTNNSIPIIKYNTSGTIQWQRDLGQSAKTSAAEGIAVDSSGNVYIAGYSTAQSPQNGYVAKYNSSGTIQWQRRLAVSGSVCYLMGVAVDSSGNVVAVGYENLAQSAIIVKYDSSGSLLWQNQIDTAANYVRFYDVTIDGNDNIIAVGQTSAAGAGGGDTFVAKVPSDGTGTGSYTLDGVSFDYSTASHTDAAGTLTDTTLSLSQNTVSYSSSASTLSTGNLSLTYEKVDI